MEQCCHSNIMETYCDIIPRTSYCAIGHQLILYDTKYKVKCTKQLRFTSKIKLLESTEQFY